MRGGGPRVIGKHARREPRSGEPTRVGLRTKIIGLLSGVLLLFSIAFIAFTYADQRSRVEAEMLEQSRMLVSEMDAVWDFVSINQYTINHTSQGEYDFKRLHCAIAGKAVAALFSRGSDYSMRFTNLNPRNFYNAPDDYERAALEGFYANAASRPTEMAQEEVYGFGGDAGGSVFRYVRSMVYDSECMECHGTPKGEIDVTGYPKEGAHIGDIAGAVSVVVPTELYFSNMRAAVAANAALFVLLMVGVAFVIFHVLSRLITTPLTELNASLAWLGEQAEGRRDGAAGVSLASAWSSGLLSSESSDAQAAVDGTHGVDGPRESSPRAEFVRSAPIISPQRPSNPYASREVDALFTQFDKMSRRLSSLYGSLESQVVDRTEQLRATNAELERQRAHVEEVNERLKRENQYKSDFLAIVSHELRTPLTSILAFTELLAQSIDPSETAALRQVEEVEKNGSILLEMVNNVLETARIQAGSERLNLELVDLNDIVGMVETSNESVALKRGVAFSTNVDSDVPLIESDWEKVRRILVNLVSNAIKFTPEGGHVEVNVAYEPCESANAAEKPVAAVDEPGAPGGTVRIDVTDTGIGIPADKQRLVFERFTQENMSTVRRYGGSGLGLSLVKDLVAMLGGTVELKSAPGQGSTFTVRLPEGGPAANSL